MCASTHATPTYPVLHARDSMACHRCLPLPVPLHLPLPHLPSALRAQLASLATFYPKPHYATEVDSRSKLPYTRDHLLVSREHLTRFTDCCSLNTQLVDHARAAADANTGRRAGAAKGQVAAGKLRSGEHRALGCKLRVIEGRWSKRSLQTGDEYVQAIEAAVRAGERLGREGEHYEWRRGGGGQQSQGGRGARVQPRWLAAQRPAFSAELHGLIAERDAAMAACTWERSEASVARLRAARSNVQRAVRGAKQQYESGSSVPKGLSLLSGDGNAI